MTLSFVCPRCQAEVTANFFGPCDQCRGELRERYQAAAGEVEAPEYEPKMNVTPNAVATKD